MICLRILQRLLQLLQLLGGFLNLAIHLLPFLLGGLLLAECLVDASLSISDPALPLRSHQLDLLFQPLDLFLLLIQHIVRLGFAFGVRISRSALLPRPLGASLVSDALLQGIQLVEQLRLCNAWLLRRTPAAEHLSCDAASRALGCGLSAGEKVFDVLDFLCE